MFNDETQVNDDTLQDETSEEAEETSNEESEETTEEQDWKKEALKWKAIAERNKHKKEFKKVAQPQSQSVEETVLLAQGMDPDLVNHLKKVAKLNGTTLLAAQADPLFTTFKEKHEQEKLVESASLGASGGSGTREAVKNFTTPNLSSEDHKKMYKEAIKNLRV